MESGTSAGYQQAKAELNRFLENEPTGSDVAKAWEMLGYACQRTNDSLGEVNALIERAQISSVPFYDISNTANRLNQLLREGLGVGKEEKRLLAQRLATVLERRRNEASANDLSKMAWLAFHLDNEEKAKEYAKAGLAIDPTNFHCSNILDRLEIISIQRCGQ
jgi:hypothetical protein